MSVARSRSWKGRITQLRALGERNQNCVANTVSSLLSAARMEQPEKFLIPGIRNGCAIALYNMQIIPFNQKFPSEERENLQLFTGHLRDAGGFLYFSIFSEGERMKTHLN